MLGFTRSRPHAVGRDGDPLWKAVPAWLAAVGGRAAFAMHALAGHRVEWRRLMPDAGCAGDIICDDCQQVLWCRAHDPWRTRAADWAADDHWGAARPRPVPRPLLDVLYHVLRLADRCPRDASGDAVRRIACRLIEAVSTRERRVARRQLLTRLDRMTRTRPVTDERGGAVRQLTDIVRHELPRARAATDPPPMSGRRTGEWW